MSVEAMKWAFDLDLKDPPAKAVLNAAASYADQDQKCFPSVDRLCVMTGFSKRTIQQALGRLEALGLVRREERVRQNGSNTSSLMFLMVGQGAADAPSPPAADSPPGVQDVREGGAAAAPPEENNSNPRKDSKRDIAREAALFFDERFWPTYPKRNGGNPKEAAKKKIVALVVSGENPEEILAGVVRLKQGLAARGKVGTEFVPMAITWLNRKGWKDDPEAPPPMNGGPRGGPDRPRSFFDVAMSELGDVKGTDHH